MHRSVSLDVDTTITQDAEKSHDELVWPDCASSVGRARFCVLDAADL